MVMALLQVSIFYYSDDCFGRSPKGVRLKQAIIIVYKQVINIIRWIKQKKFALKHVQMWADGNVFITSQ